MLENFLQTGNILMELKCETSDESVQNSKKSVEMFLKHIICQKTDNCELLRPVADDIVELASYLDRFAGTQISLSDMVYMKNVASFPDSIHLFAVVRCNNIAKYIGQMAESEGK